MEAHAANHPASPSAPRAGIRRLPGVGAGLGRGLVVLYLSIMVLLPLAALTSKSLSQGLGHFWDQVTSPGAINALELTLATALGDIFVVAPDVLAPWAAGDRATLTLGTRGIAVVGLTK